MRLQRSKIESRDSSLLISFNMCSYGIGSFSEAHFFVPRLSSLQIEWCSLFDRWWAAVLPIGSLTPGPTEENYKPVPHGPNRGGNSSLSLGTGGEHFGRGNRRWAPHFPTFRPRIGAWSEHLGSRDGGWTQNFLPISGTCVRVFRDLVWDHRWAFR